MFGIVSRRCASTSRRVWATPPLSVGFSPLALSAVFGAGQTARGKCTKSVELADFLAVIGVPDKRMKSEVFFPKHTRFEKTLFFKGDSVIA